MDILRILVKVAGVSTLMKVKEDTETLQMENLRHDG